MNTFIIIFRNVLLFVALAVPGYLLVKSSKLKAAGSGPLSLLLMYVGLPFLIFNSTVKNLVITPSLVLYLLAVAGLGIVFLLMMFFLSSVFAKGERDIKKSGVFRFSAMFANNGFLGIPLGMAVFGADSPVMTVLIMLNIINNVVLYTVGIYLISGDKKNMSLKKAFLNPVFIAFVCGLIVNVLGVKDVVPEVMTFAGHFSNIVTPVSMVILGMKMAEMDMKKLFVSGKMYYVSFLRLILFPALITAALLAAKAFIPGAFFSVDLILGFFIAFAMPTAGMASTFADTFNGDVEGAAIQTLGSTLLSVITIPLLYTLLCMILGV